MWASPDPRARVSDGPRDGRSCPALHHTALGLVGRVDEVSVRAEAPGYNDTWFGHRTVLQLLIMFMTAVFNLRGSPRILGYISYYVILSIYYGKILKAQQNIEKLYMYLLCCIFSQIRSCSLSATMNLMC